jgi:hypothetical protein
MMTALPRPVSALAFRHTRRHLRRRTIFCLVFYWPRVGKACCLGMGQSMRRERACALGLGQLAPEVPPPGPMAGISSYPFRKISLPSLGGNENDILTSVIDRKQGVWTSLKILARDSATSIALTTIGDSAGIPGRRIPFFRTLSLLSFLSRARPSSLQCRRGPRSHLWLSLGGSRLGLVSSRRVVPVSSRACARRARPWDWLPCDWLRPLTKEATSKTRQVRPWDWLPCDWLSPITREASSKTNPHYVIFVPPQVACNVFNQAR